MALIAIKCPSCGGDINLDESRDFGFCMYCGTKVSLSQRIKVEHSGEVSLKGLATIDALIKKGFMNVATNDYVNAKDSFQKVLSLDTENIYALIGMMCVSSENASHYYYEKIRLHSDEFCEEEARFLDKYTCHVLAKKYALEDDYKRLDAVLQRFPECVQEIFLCKKNCVAKVELLVKYGISPSEAFWRIDTPMQTEALEYLLALGMNPNEINPNKYARPHYLTPLAKALGLEDYADQGSEIHYKDEQLDLAECLLKNGANQNVRIPVRLKFSGDIEEREIRYCNMSTQASVLLKSYRPKKGFFW